MESLTGDDPRSIGGYEVRARLGAGGFGRVYLGLSPGGRAVAIKVLRPELREDQEFLTRFRLEVAAARQVNGFYTAQVVATGLDDRRPWIATGFVPGPPLDRVVVANGPLSELALWRLLAGLVEALQAIHDCGLVHRDLKPANVLLAADGPRVIDFGISKAIDGTAMTSVGAIMGTPSFMAPEQVTGEAVGPESDVFALGSVLAYAATGKPPFGRDSYASVLYRIVHGGPVLDGVPVQLRAVIEGCLAKAPAARARLTELARIGRDGPLASSTPSALAFWPPKLAQLIGEYQSQVNAVETGDAQELSRAATASSALTAGGSSGGGAEPGTPLPDSATPVTILRHQEGRHPPAGYQQEPEGERYDEPDGHKNLDRRRGRRRWLAWAAAGAVCLVAVAVVAIMLTSGGGIPVPGLSGKTQAQAVAAIDAAGFKPVVVSKADARVRSGLVISSDPAQGSAIGKGQTITVYLSTGPATAIVPLVDGLTWLQAEAQIKAAGLAPVEHQEASLVVKAGEVISLTPAAGSSAPGHGNVTVNVSTGVAHATLPNFKGTQGTSARARLQKLGFVNFRLTSDPESTLPSGEVDHMTPAPGSYPMSQQVVLYVSEGGIQVPNVVDQTEAEATVILQQDGFTVQATSTAAPSSQMVTPGVVYSQGPAAGQTEPEGTLIQVFVQPESPTAPASNDGGDNGDGGGPGGFF
ncbi:MAG TPA: PASTA domain-containing protein [Trebonia sp.]